MSSLLDVLVQHSAHVKDYWASDIPRINVRELTPLDFLRDYVCPNRPVVLKGAVDQWLAQQWCDLDSLEALTDEKVTVSVTPNGRADALTIDAEGAVAFVKPHNQSMPFSEALRTIRSECRRHGPGAGQAAVCGIPYLSFQNDSLRQQTPALLQFISDVKVAAAALAAGEVGGSPGPQGTAAKAGLAALAEGLGLRALGASANKAFSSADAVNLWIGTPRSVSSIHKDAYENLYTVLKGRKQFTLLPPSDITWLYERPYPSATWVHDDGACSCGGKGRTGSSVAAAGCEDHRAPGQGGTRAESTRGTGTSTCPPCWRIEYDTAEEDGETGTTTAADGNKSPNEPPAPPRRVLVPWISVDPSAPDLQRFPLYKHASPLVVDVHEGETLYLPSLWYHQVAQPGLGTDADETDTTEADPDDQVTVALNCWFNMSFLGQGWAHYNLASNLASLLGTRVPLPAGTEA